jgi:hypothetical protein
MVTGERWLMLGVMKRAVDDLLSPSCAIRWRAHEWFFASDGKRDHVFAFPRICREFSCDPAAVRSRIFATVPNGRETSH